MDLVSPATRRSPGTPRLRRMLTVLACLLPALMAGPPAQAASERRHIDARTGMLEVPLEELLVAVKRRDRAEIGRIAERIGPARLGAALRRADAQGVPAAAPSGLTCGSRRWRPRRPVRGGRSWRR